MELTINGKDYELRFGIKAINTLDNLNKQSIEGLEFGVGVEMTNTKLSMGRPQGLVEAIKAGTSHLKSKPSTTDIEEYVEELAESDFEAYDKLFNEIKEAMEQSPFLKKIMKNLK